MISRSEAVSSILCSEQGASPNILLGLVGRLVVDIFNDSLNERETLR